MSQGLWVIFEGPDGGGKTTMAAASATILADPRRQGGAPTVLHHLTSESEFGEYSRPRLWQRAGLNIVQDRCLLSDLVYAPVWLGVPSRMGEERVREELRRYIHLAAMVYVAADEQVLLERMRERADDRPAADPDESQVHALLKNYWREISWWRDIGGLVYEVDTTSQFLEGIELELMLSVVSEEMAVERGG